MSAVMHGFCISVGYVLTALNDVSILGVCQFARSLSCQLREHVLQAGTLCFSEVFPRATVQWLRNWSSNLK